MEDIEQCRDVTSIPCVKIAIDEIFVIH